MSNLEPIEDSDLDLKSKFIEGEKTESKALEGDKKEKTDFVLEKTPEKGKEGAVEKEKTYSKILSKMKTTTAPADDKTVASDAKTVSDADGAEDKIETLIKLATTKGVVHAVKVARHLDDNYALDEFHDRMLADELHDALAKKGLIKEV
jgi:hypothetical protein